MKMLFRKHFELILICILIIATVGCSGEGQKSSTGKNAETNDIEAKVTPLNDKIDKVNSIDINTDLGDTVRPQEIKLVKKSDKTKYLLHNGVEENSIEKMITIPDRDGEIKFTIPQISGLKDKEVEQKVNTQIINDIENGVKEYVNTKKDLSLSNFNIYCIVALNANNLLSIEAVNAYSPPIIGLLYKLSDGKRLYLKDIFTQGTDSLGLINRKISEYCMKNECYASKCTNIDDAIFVLSGSSLSIDGININLSEIDDYVDVLDRYSGVERKTHERQDLIFRRNNIFTDEKSGVYRKKNGDVLVMYPELSGTGDNAFEDLVNKMIKDSIDEVLADKELDNIMPHELMPLEIENIAEIRYYAKFNSYGVLSLERNIYVAEDKLKDYHKVYSFNVINKKPVDTKKMLIDYISNDNKMKEKFISLIKESLKNTYKDSDKTFSFEKISFDYIANNCEMYFSDYNNNVNVSVNFNKASTNELAKGISQNLTCEVSLKDIINRACEDFFGW
jgi:hypothetical protein